MVKSSPVLSGVLRAVTRFMKVESASAVILLVCAFVAMTLANSSLGPGYESVLDFRLWLPVRTWINDALMAIFFYVVGMEIKSELTDGALATREKATLPVVAALGGMIAPALVYTLLSPAGEAKHGWGIPMATDIAFAVGILSLLGKRVPTQLKIFLLALAIADDLGAVLVIAIFYTSGIHLLALAGSFALFAVIFALSRKGIRHVWLHLPLALLSWFLMHESGIHATIAGVVLGFLMPHEDDNPNDPTPLERWVHILHPYVGYGIMPLFALANAGVVFGEISLANLMTDPLVSAVSYGLFIGKPVGIFAASFLAVKMGLAQLPERVNWAAIFGAGLMGGIGFTMAIFIAQLALKTPEHIGLAKIGIMKGSLLSAVVGLVFLAIAVRNQKANESSGR